MAPEVQDLEKAVWYLRREIATLKQTSEGVGLIFH